MTLRTKSEQKAYLDGFEMCADCIENYLSDKGKELLKCLLVSVRSAVEIEDISELKEGDEEECERRDCGECEYDEGDDEYDY